MFNSSVEKLAESKLTILYLLDKMEIPMSKGQICQFALEANYIEYFSLQTYIAEMVDSNFLREIDDDGKLIYISTDEGMKMLSLFKHRIPYDIKKNVQIYVDKMKNKVRKELETKATYIHIGENNYNVNCGIYEDDKILIELKVNVVSREQAVLACKNWKNKMDSLYLDIITNILKKED